MRKGIRLELFQEIKFYRMVSIYALVDKKEKAVIYIGATIKPKSRMLNHMATTLKNYRNRLFVEMIVLEVSKINSAGKKERKWYNRYASLGAPLLNNPNQQFYYKIPIDYRN